MRIAFLLDIFPVISETFILRQITSLLDTGHHVDVYAKHRPPTDVPIHVAVRDYELLERTIYLDMPAVSGEWEMPVWPISGETWIPGAETAISNRARILEAVPVLIECLRDWPELTLKVLEPDEYGIEAQSLSALYRLAKMGATRRRYDIVHAHFGPVANTFRFARELWQAPLAVTFHGYDFSTVPRHFGTDVYRRLFRDADGVMAVSQYAKARLEKLGCSSHKVQVLHTGLNPDEFPFRARVLTPGEPVRILTVGRLVEKKGVEYAVRAMAEVRRRGFDIRYEIIGEGPLRAALDALVRQLGLADVVMLRGAADGVFVRQRMECSHLFLLPSVTSAEGDEEGIPVSLMEAQACGLPVVSTHHSGIPELVCDGSSGLLVPERDVEAIAGGVCYLIEHPYRWIEMGREGREIVKAEFDIHKLNRDLVSLYERLASQAVNGTGSAKS